MFKPMLGVAAVGLAMATAAVAQNPIWTPADDAAVVTASNTAANQLMFYNSTGTLLKTIPTHGQGGVGGNAGGIAISSDRLAVVNFGSGNVSVFVRNEDAASYRFEQMIQALASPVSVAFGHEHLYILSTTQVESHSVGRHGVGSATDGSASLILQDGSAAQVGVIEQQLVVSEKTGDIETVTLNGQGAITGNATVVAHLPNPALAPFGLVTRGNDAYVTIAHSNEISLVRNDAVVTLTSSGTQNAPCWLALDGPFLFSANSPSQSVSRYLVYGQHIIQDVAVAASFNGNPTDIAYRAGLAAVVDSNGTVSHVSIFKVDEEGNLTLNGVATINGAATNGIAVLRGDD
jgi:hypothetical protein